MKNYFRVFIKSLVYYFFEIKAPLSFKIKYFLEKGSQYFIASINWLFWLKIPLPYFFEKDYIIEDTIWKYYIKPRSDYDYPIQPYVEDRHEKYWNLKDWSVFLDIWWHVWTYCIKILHHNKWKNIKCYCFEPHPETFKYLQKNIELNSIATKVTPINKWVYSKSWKISFTNSWSDSAAVSKIIEDDSSVNTITIDTIKFDDFLIDMNINPDTIWLIKIDVEGVESEVFEWMSSFLSNCHEVNIICEILNKEKLEKITRLLTEKWLWIEAIDDFNYHIFS